LKSYELRYGKGNDDKMYRWKGWERIWAGDKGTKGGREMEGGVFQDEEGKGRLMIEWNDKAGSTLPHEYN
jgi:hypothetical protein